MLTRNSSSAVQAPASPGVISGGQKEVTEADEIFGRLVAVRRAGLGLSQEELAAIMDTSQSNVAGIEAGRPPSNESVKRLAAALNMEPGRGALWNSLGGRWLLGGLAIAVMVPALLIFDWPSSDIDGRHSSQQSPQAVSTAPGSPVAGAKIVASRGRRAGEEGRGKGRSPSAPSGGKAPASPAGPQQAPASPGTLVAPEPPSQQSPSTQPAQSGPTVTTVTTGTTGTTGPTSTTGKPAGSPGNGPGGGGGPGGTGPPGQGP